MVAKQRQLEQQRAEHDRIKATQDQLQQETLLRGGGLGVASLVGPGVARRRGTTPLLGW